MANRRGRGLSLEAVTHKSEIRVWSSELPETCVICCETFSTTDVCRVLECAHTYHVKCVDLWFIKHTFCPLCKHDLNLTHNRSQSSLSRSSSDSSLRFGTVLFGHSNSDPALLRGF